MIEVSRFDVEGPLLLTPKVFCDARGEFFESYNKRAFDEAIGREVTFVQDNHSVSNAGVVRGLHYQVAPSGQAKVVRVISGEIFDVAVDVRLRSPHFGKWIGVRLSAENRHQLWLPEGFAHGLVALSDGTECLYKTTSHYDPDSERCIAWNDPDVGIEWPIDGDPVLSDKDAGGSLFRDAQAYS